jgi:hypothetical protein
MKRPACARSTFLLPMNEVDLVRAWLKSQPFELRMVTSSFCWWKRLKLNTARMLPAVLKAI